MSNLNLTIRKAIKSDIPFLIKAIIEADKSGTTNSSYCNLLSISEDEFYTILVDIFEEELEEVEFGYESFFVLVNDINKPIACCASWIEGRDGVPSWQKRMMALRTFASKQSIDHLLSLQNEIKGFMPERTPNTIQIESVYVDLKYRGLGYVSYLLNYVFNTYIESIGEGLLVEVMTYSSNNSAIKVYQKLGFTISEQTIIKSDVVNKIYSSDGMIKFEKKYN